MRFSTFVAAALPMGALAIPAAAPIEEASALEQASGASDSNNNNQSSGKTTDSTADLVARTVGGRQLFGGGGSGGIIGGLVCIPYNILTQNILNDIAGIQWCGQYVQIDYKTITNVIAAAAPTVTVTRPVTINGGGPVTFTNFVTTTQAAAAQAAVTSLVTVSVTVPGETNVANCLTAAYKAPVAGGSNFKRAVEAGEDTPVSIPGGEVPVTKTKKRKVYTTAVNGTPVVHKPRHGHTGKGKNVKPRQTHTLPKSTATATTTDDVRVTIPVVQTTDNVKVSAPVFPRETTLTKTKSKRTKIAVSTSSPPAPLHTAPLPWKRDEANEDDELSVGFDARGIYRAINPPSYVPKNYNANQINLLCSCANIPTQTTTVQSTSTPPTVTSTVAPQVTINPAVSVTVQQVVTVTAVPARAKTVVSTVTSTVNSVATAFAPSKLTYKEFTSPFDAFTNANSFTADYFKGKSPNFSGVWPTPNFGTPYWPSMMAETWTMQLDQAKPFNAQQIAILFQGFFLAPLSGTYTFTSDSNNNDNFAEFWAGDDAFQWADASNDYKAIRGATTSSTGTTSVTLNAGDAMPFTYLWANGGGPGRSSFTITLPDGTQPTDFSQLFARACNANVFSS